MIESTNNLQIRKVTQLKKSAKVRKKESRFLAEGWKMVQEAADSGLLDTIYISEEVKDDFYVEKRGQRLPEPVVVSDKVFREIADTKTPQGVLATVKMPQYHMEDYMKAERTAFLCLEGIQDPGNLGTMMRTAEGAGMTGVILSKDTVDLFNPKVVRATMGSLYRVPFFLAEDFIETMMELKENGVKLMAAHLQGSSFYTEVKYHARMGVLIGNEANGLSDEASELADIKVKIPMKGKLESLNAAVSAALFMYEISRDRRS